MTLYQECTTKCKSKVHGNCLTSAITKGTPPQIRSYFKKLCLNFVNARDDNGRTILHMAASCGASEVVQWLLEYCNVNPEVKDLESGWTALHRSIYYGQLSCANILLNYCKNPRILDLESFSPFDLLLHDRLDYVTYSLSDPQDVFVWGSNTNYTLGLGKHETRSTPELLEKFQKENISIQKVVLGKFHSAFLSNVGSVYTCGHGHGGRLGLKNEDTILVPTKVKAISQPVIQVAIARDHSVFLTEEGQVWTCGINTYHQLGHSSPPDKIITPRYIPQKLFLGQELIGISAGRFHTVVYSKTTLFTFGLNAGQLGHQRGAHTISTPHLVTSLKIPGLEFNHVVASDGATVCSTLKGEIFVLHEYLNRIITSKQLCVKKICVTGGNLDAKCNAAEIKESGGSELKVAILTDSGNVYLWAESSPILRRCLIYSGPKNHLLIRDFDLNVNNFILSTQHGQAYIGHKLQFSPDSSKHPSATTNKSSEKALKLFLDIKECYVAHVKPLSGIYRSNQVVSDLKGRNFAILQSDAKTGLYEIPVISSKTLNSNLQDLLNTSCSSDLIHDVVLKIGNKTLYLHKFILASRSAYFKKLILAEPKIKELAVEDYGFETVKLCIQFIYSGECDIYHTANTITRTTDAFKLDNSKKSEYFKTLLNQTISLSKKWSLTDLNAQLQRLKSKRDNNINVSKIKASKFGFKWNSLPALCDVLISTGDDKTISAHKAILYSQVEFYKGMFSYSWIESSTSKKVSFPFSSKLLECLLEFIYSESQDNILNCSDVSFLCETLIVADQFLITRMKEACEAALASNLTLKLAAQLLEFSINYQARQLQTSCMQFICLNLGPLLENRLLDVLSTETMAGLTHYYRTQMSNTHYRVITQTDSAPSSSELLDAEIEFPIDDQTPFVFNSLGNSHHTSRLPRKHSGSNLETKIVPPNLNLKKEIIHRDTSDTSVTSPVSPPPKLSTLSKPIATPKNTRGAPTSPLWNFSPQEFPGICESTESFKFEKKSLTQSFSSEKKKKLSQKQRKALSKNGGNLKDPLLSPTSPCPWGNLSIPESPPISFWDQNRMKVTSPLDIPELNREVDAFATSPSLKEIQREQTIEEVQLITKPFHVIHLEEEAIQQLLELYLADNPDDEIITVERIQTRRAANPVWKCNKKKITF